MPRSLQGGQPIIARFVVASWLIVLAVASPALAESVLASGSAESTGLQLQESKQLIVLAPAMTWTDAVALLNSSGASTVASLLLVPDAYHATYPDASTAASAVSLLAGNPAVTYAEPDLIAHYSYEPDDPMFDDQLWARAIDLPAAWNITAGSDAVTVAVVDSGVQASHPDLAGKVLPGRDLFHRDDEPEDDIGHGTAVAGIIAARGDDGVGVAGVAMDVQILPVKVGGKDGAPISILASGIIWAVDEGANIINLSLVADLPSATLEEALQYAYDHNVAVITAAGNNPESVTYPGNYELAITVGASTNWGTLAAFSSRANRVDLVAPGSSILAPWWSESNGNGWTTVTGTSFAAPMVTGAAALLLSIDPGLTVEEIRELLQGSAAPIGEPLLEPGSGAGQLDVGTAIRQLLTTSFDATWSPADNPVANDLVDRSWLWGPASLQTGFERYVDAREGERLVRYYDKARMEINDPLADAANPWYVTNGLLVSEMITGRMQIGDNLFQYRGSAEIAIAGDPGDPAAPTYADLRQLLDALPGSTGGLVTQLVDSEGHVAADDAYGVFGITYAAYNEKTNHQIASVFWDYLNSHGLILADGSIEYGPLFNPIFFATGLPITEPYWLKANVDGVPTDVLVQCFERRCLTYNPNNAFEWRVEMGNVGLHYYSWRYQDNFDVNPDARFQDIIPQPSQNADLQHHRVPGQYSLIR